MKKQIEHVVHNVQLFVTILYNIKLKLERLIFPFGKKTTTLSMFLLLKGTQA